jgi:hypothetical protein
MGIGGALFKENLTSLFSFVCSAVDLCIIWRSDRDVKSLNMIAYV